MKQFNKKNKRAQEEIVGFVAIVLIVSIVMIVFLGIFLRKDKSPQGNIEVSQFLDAIVETTTKCGLDNGFSYKKYSELVKLCNEGDRCSGEDACDILYEYTKEMIENSWNFSPHSLKKGYRFNICFKPEDSDECLPYFLSVLRWVGGSSYERNERSISANDGDIIIEFVLFLD